MREWFRRFMAKMRSPYATCACCWREAFFVDRQGRGFVCERHQ